MSRLSKFISESAKQKDWFAMGLLGVAVLIACWITSLLFLQSTRKVAIERFHLASPSWLSWAILAPVPPMYNFENRIQFSNELLGVEPFDKEHESWFECPVNHFPARCATFGEFAPTWFGETRQGTFEMSTRFREDELVSRWKILEQADGSMVVHRESEDWVRHDANK